MSLIAHDIHLQRHGKIVLAGVSCGIASGEVLGILGANGAGKSTLLALLAGDLAPQAGSVALDGKPLAGVDNAALARRRAVLSQQLGPAFNLSVQDIAAMGAYPFPELAPQQVGQVCRDALAMAEVAHLAQRRYPELSGGEQQRVQFARVLVQALAARQPGEARYLLLDEPTASLDPRHQHGLLALAARLAHDAGLGIAVVLHDVNLAACWCTRIALLANASIVASGTPTEVLQAGHLEATYRQPCTIHPHPTRPGRPLVLFA
ncbi:heme ABC transporter ATP-binding protein [Chitinilyticum litopenaei]|uniref:heme ABC transporter ATP-binding protein n=1 Tax=Chitinilyticum litopenaei TaxID=1121276 RepID=UPI0003F60CB5|nr:heme ABC transporter ATP-binding protein [Chitinilyticum litopenaei]